MKIYCEGGPFEGEYACQILNPEYIEITVGKGWQRYNKTCRTHAGLRVYDFQEKRVSMTPLQQAIEALGFYSADTFRHDGGDKARAALAALVAPLADPAGLQGQDLVGYWKLRALSAEEAAIAGILNGVRAYQRDHVKAADPEFTDFMPEDSQEAVKWLLAKMSGFKAM
jgi:hypothetical protein